MDTEEGRSFEPPPRDMGELTPIDVRNGTVKDALHALQTGVVQTHSCLEQHIAEQSRHNATQALANLAAAEKREAMAGDLAELRGEFRGLVLALGIRKPEEGEEKPRSGALATWGVKKVAGWGSAVVVGAVAIIQAAIAAVQSADWTGVAATLEKLGDLLR